MDKPTPIFKEEDVLICDECGKPTFPNLSLGDEDGYAWSCTTLGCPDYFANEIEAEDLIAVGVPEWVAERIADLIEKLTEEG